MSRRDWRLVGCRVRLATFAHTNTVGTFGISSASYYWSRIGSRIGRLVQYVAGTSATTWFMLVADDHHIETCGISNRPGLIAFFAVCSLLGVSPLVVKNLGRRHTHLGRIRTSPQLVSIGSFPEACRMVFRRCPIQIP